MLELESRCYLEGSTIDFSNNEINTPLDQCIKACIQIHKYSLQRNSRKAEEVFQQAVAHFEGNSKQHGLLLITNFNHNLRSARDISSLQDTFHQLWKAIPQCPEHWRHLLARHAIRGLALSSLANYQERISFKKQTPAGEENRIAIAMMIKDEVDIIKHNLMHHYSIGFRKFFILLNGCTDRSLQKILKFQDRFPDADVVYINDPIKGYTRPIK